MGYTRAVPIYDYRCASCGAPFDRLVRIGSDERPECPVCGSPETERLVSLVARGAACGPTGFG